MRGDCDINPRDLALRDRRGGAAGHRGLRASEYGRPGRQADRLGCVAWVEVPGTSIDEPVAQATPDAPNAYLHADAIGQGAYGTPYIDCEGSVDSRYVMVFEHHMSDGSAFADFASFIDEGYAREHAKIIVYRRKGETLNLRPVAVDVVNASRERLVIDQEAGFGKIVEGSDLILEEPVEDGQLFAFTTCSYQTRNSKTTVFAVWGYNAH